MSYKSFFYLALVGVTAACQPLPPADPDADLKAEAKGRHLIAQGERPIYAWCAQNQKVPLESLVNYSDTIITGTVLERHFKIKDFSLDNRCFVKIQVERTLKGSVGKEVWVEAVYPHWPPQELWNPKNCYLKLGKRYLLAGRSGTIPISGFTFMNVGKDNSAKPEYTCAPVEELPAGAAVVKQIETILKEEKSK